MTDWDNKRDDKVHIIVRVLKTRNDYRMVKRKPYRLEANEICLSLSFFLNLKEWFERVKEYEITLSPPTLANPEGTVFIEKDTPQKVVDRMKGK